MEALNVPVMAADLHNGIAHWGLFLKLGYFILGTVCLNVLLSVVNLEVVDREVDFAHVVHSDVKLELEMPVLQVRRVGRRIAMAASVASRSGHGKFLHELVLALILVELADEILKKWILLRIVEK
jgi:hypothetical protein